MFCRLKNTNIFVNLNKASCVKVIDVLVVAVFDNGNVTLDSSETEFGAIEKLNNIMCAMANGQLVYQIN